jgi:hypothetical protein
VADKDAKPVLLYSPATGEYITVEMLENVLEIVHTDTELPLYVQRRAEEILGLFAEEPPF